MSAYIVDPRTIDYLVQWAQRHHSHDRSPAVTVPENLQVPATLASAGAYPGGRLHLVQLSPDVLGGILLAENVRSVRSRYPDDTPDDLPGPCDKRNVFAYRFRRIEGLELDPSWVIRACDCLDYQSCETPEWRETLAFRIMDAIREDAIRTLVADDAPWGVDDSDLDKARAALAAKRAKINGETMRQLRAVKP